MTLTLPVMPSWKMHLKRYTPGRLKRFLVASPWSMTTFFLHLRPLRPLLWRYDVTVCRPLVAFHTILPPTAIVRLAGSQLTPAPLIVFVAPSEIELIASTVAAATAATRIQVTGLRSAAFLTPPLLLVVLRVDVERYYEPGSRGDSGPGKRAPRGPLRAPAGAEKSAPRGSGWLILLLPDRGRSSDGTRRRGMEQGELPDPERSASSEQSDRGKGLIEDALERAARRLAEERGRARARAVQLAREQAYHRLAVAIDRPKPAPSARQLSLFPEDPTLFDDVD